MTYAYVRLFRYLMRSLEICKIDYCLSIYLQFSRYSKLFIYMSFSSFIVPKKKPNCLGGNVSTSFPKRFCLYSLRVSRRSFVEYSDDKKF